MQGTAGQIGDREAWTTSSEVHMVLRAELCAAPGQHGGGADVAGTGRCLLSPVQEKHPAWVFAKPLTLDSWLPMLPLMVPPNPPAPTACLELFVFKRAVYVFY